MSRVALYVDGFNLYFGMKGKGWHRYYWLDLVALGHHLSQPGDTLVAAHYFTARIRADGRNAADVARQKVYLDALDARGGLKIHTGHYLVKENTCRRCGAQWTSYEEKMTDVNIAVRMFADAVDDVFDTALLVSADSDLTPPVAEIRARYPQKRVVIALPPDRTSKQLWQAANAHFHINEVAFRQCQLPEVVTGPTGYELRRPPTWT